MEHLYIQRKGDSEKLLKYRDMYKTYNNKKLIESYNSTVEMGVVGSHEQGLHLISKRMVFMNRFGKSPIKIKDNVLITLSGKIVQAGENYSYLRPLKLHLKNGQDQYLKATSIVDLDSEFVIVKPFMDEVDGPLLFRFLHANINTHLILTDVSPYALIYLDKDLEFKGATYSIKSGDGTFMIKTQYRNILLVKLPLPVDLNSIKKVEYDY